jgi:hypothetical protein
MYSIIRASEKDVDRVCQFFEERKHTERGAYIPKPWIRISLTGDKKNRPSPVLMATDRDKIIGVAIMTNRRMLWRVLVDIKYRNQGVGRSLVEHLNPLSVRATKESVLYWIILGIKQITISGGNKCK